MPAALLACAGTVWAQDDADSEQRWVPVETFTCDYNDGKSRADLNDVIDEWNAWMDDQDAGDYFAAVITPQYYGEYNFDVGWLGAWRDGKAMGAGTDMWTTAGGELGARFFEVIDCESHTNFASTLLKAPSSDDDDSDKTFVLEFSNCTINEGQEFEQVIDALSAWSEYQVENGFTNSRYMMFPVYGESNNDYAFKMVQGQNDYTALGADWDRMGNGGHWMKQYELLSGVIDCDVSRLYDAVSVREWAEDEEE